MGDSFTAEPDIKVNPDSITVSINTERKTAFMRLAGTEEVPIDVMAEVTRPKSKNAEVVLVLDYSYSMVAKNKYVSMRNAASNLIDKLAESEVSSLKFGLVPFSAMVRLSMPKTYVTQNSATPTWTGCTQDRKYPYNTSDSTPTSNNNTKWGYIDPIGENSAPHDCQAYKNKELDVVPLTGDLDEVKSRMQAMQPVGNTNIPLGVEFGWHLLSPNEPFTEGAPYDDKETMKFMIVLTDGVQTSRQWGPKDNRSVNNGNANLVTLCSGVKDRGITVYTIAYDVTSAVVTDLLKACAGSNYFNSSDSAEEIDSVFNEIASRIGSSLVRIAR
jgi:Mg-chelatase subunit ChlD